MTDVQPMGSTATMTIDPAERIAQQLLYNPSDLMDARRLMQHFRASVDDSRRTFTRLDQLTPPERETATR